MKNKKMTRTLSALVGLLAVAITLMVATKKHSTVGLGVPERSSETIKPVASVQAPGTVSVSTAKTEEDDAVVYDKGATISFAPASKQPQFISEAEVRAQIEEQKKAQNQ